MNSFGGGVVAAVSGEISVGDGVAEVVGGVISIGNGEEEGGDFSFIDSGDAGIDGVITVGKHMVVVGAVVEGVTSMGEGEISSRGRVITAVGVAVGDGVGEAKVSDDDDDVVQGIGVTTPAN